jgi:negative regulator of flagellin synthesis FlgM
MEIENNRITTLVTGSNGQGTAVNKPQGKDAPAAQDATSGKDKVSLSDTAAQLRNLQDQLASQPVVDRQRVAAVRNAIDNGTFAVDSLRIADKLISLEQALNDVR